MEEATTQGVLNRLSLLETQTRSRKTPPEQASRVKQLKAKVEALRAQRDRLKADIETHKNLQKMRASLDRQHAHEEEEEEMNEDSESSQLLRVMARHTQVKDLLHAHYIIGGYNVMKTRQGKGVCVSLATAYDDVYLETYNLEMDLQPKLRIIRHNIPPFIPLNSLAEQSGVLADMRPFLGSLSQHLNAFTGRKQQLELVKELHKSVEVMESNALCSLLVVMLTVPRTKTAVLCTLHYTDHRKCLPTRVHFESEDQELPNSPEWKKNCSLLMETPVHKALTTMRKMGNIM